MSNSKSIRRLVENEVVFRQSNEKVFKGFDELKRLAKEEGYKIPKIDKESTLFFYCECADENCRKRIELNPEEYQSIHKARDTFTVACGHEVQEIEQTVEERDGYCIVKKNYQPPKRATRLHSTEVDNS